MAGSGRFEAMGERAIAAVAERSGGDLEPQERVVNVLTYIGHYARAHGMDFHRLTAIAVQRVCTERREASEP